LYNNIKTIRAFNFPNRRRGDGGRRIIAAPILAAAAQRLGATTPLWWRYTPTPDIADKKPPAAMPALQPAALIRLSRADNEETAAATAV
jgi:hypothetical protein